MYRLQNKRISGAVDTQQTSKERYRELSRALCASRVSLFRRSRAFYFCILDYR